jgi:hypothetical protein
MGSSKPEVKDRSSGRRFWNVAHGDLAVRHPRMYVVVVILLILLLAALAAYLLLDIANRSSLPPFSKAVPQCLFPEGCSFGIPYDDVLRNSNVSHETALSRNSTNLQETSPSQEIATSPNGSIESLFSLNLQGSAAVLAAGVGSLENATAHSMNPEGVIPGIRGQAKALHESLWQLPSSINSWASPTLLPLLQSLGDNARRIGDLAGDVPLPRANFSFEPS